MSIKKNDKPVITSTFKEMREELTKLERTDPYVLSMACPKEKVDFDFAKILKYVDFLNIETSEYYSFLHESEYAMVGPPAPLHGNHPDKKQLENVEETLKYYTCLTKRPNKLNMMLSSTGTFWNR